MKILYLPLLVACFGSFLTTTSTAAETARPNVLVIMTDDLGYGDVGCYGATAVKTPHIDRLADEGLRFTSGYASAATCTPTRYATMTGKYSIYEGGTRTPFITRWPAKIQPGVSDEVVCVVDLPASMAAFTGQTLASDACPDSFDLMPALLGKKGAKGRDHIVEQGRGLALRVGDWKLLEHPSAKAIKSLTYQKGAGKFELFNLADDPGERQNLIAREPERAQKMKEQLATIRGAGRSRP